ncbi:MAG: hypothetical protein HZA60_08285 [Deltaproteobacteria bacterium]|nr:hypothetical protein [Deltaproteobacteria bacterium]
MERKRKAPQRLTRPARKENARRGKAPAPGKEELLQDALTARAKEGDVEAFLALVRFHSTFNPIPLSRDLLLISGLDELTRRRLIGRLKRKEDSLLRPFPSVDMMFWGETWVQEALNRFLWKKRGRKPVPNEEFLQKLWDATREGAVLQLKIYKKAHVTPSAWVRVKYPHYSNLELSDAQILKIARAEGCRFEEPAFENAIRRFRGSG